MVAEELYIEGRRVDLFPGSVSRNLQINNLGDVKDYMANYSNTIDLPRTPLNVSILDFLGVNGNRSEAPYRQLHARYVVNGIPLVVNGYAVVKATSDRFEVIIYDGIKDLAERIKGLTLRDLNYSDLNHYLTPQTYESSLSNTEGYIYAIGEFLPRAYFSSIRIEEQAPSLFVKTIWDKIFAEAGLSYSGDFFAQNTDYKSEVITPTTGYEVENVVLDSTPIGGATTNNISRQDQSTDPFLQFWDQHTLSATGQSGITVHADGRIEIHDDGQIEVNISTTYSGSGSYVRLNVMNGLRTVATIRLDDVDSPIQTTINISVSVGDELTFQLVGRPDIDQQGGSQFYWVNYTSESTIHVRRLTGGQFIDFSLFAPEMQQVDFIKDVMRRYGLLFKSVNNHDGYEFKQFEALLNDREGHEDWSSKLSHIEKEEYDIEYGKNNIASYNYPEEIVNRDYDGIMTIDNDNAPATQELFQAPYTIPTSRARQWKGQWIYQSHIWEEKEEEGETVIADVETPAKIFRIQRVDTSINTIFFDESTSNTITGSIPFLSLHNMELQYFLGRYYKAFQNLINRAKKVTAIMNLTELDIYQLDFFRLKYLSQTGRFYYLNTVRHIPGRVNRVELIEIPSFVENQPPTTLGVFSVNMANSSERVITVENITDETNPTYFDPEFDEPYAILITGGFNSDVVLKQGNQIIGSQTEILADTWNVTIEDVGNVFEAHSEAFTFKIMDEGSMQWSEVEGTIDVSVREYNNTDPIARAGDDQTLYINTDDTQESYNTFVDGSGSTDDTGEITIYQWVITDKPVQSEALLQLGTGAAATLNVPNDTLSVGKYTLQLTVVDEFGASDSDTMEITVIDNGSGGIDPIE